MAACGIGGHLVALAERGLSVLRFDTDEQAVEIARRKIEAALLLSAGQAEVVRLSMEDAGRLGPTFDAAFSPFDAETSNDLILVGRKR